MANSVEPTDVGPAVGGDQSASEADRVHVVTLLKAAQAEGRLSVDDRDQRIQQAMSASTFDDLVPLTRDLVSPTGNAALAVINYDEASATEEADQVVAILGGSSRKNAWRMRKHTSVLTLFGGVDLDLTEATFESRELEINVFCLFGGVDIVVPPGTEVDSRVHAFAGSTELRRMTPPDGVAPKVIVKGFCGFGGVDIKNPKVKSKKTR